MSAGGAEAGWRGVGTILIVSILMTVLTGTTGAADPVTKDDSKILEGKTYRSIQHNLTLSIPDTEWGKLRIGTEMKWNNSGSLVEGLSKDGNCAFVLAFESLGMTTEKYIEAWEKVQEKHHFKRKSKSALKDREGEWIHSRYDWPHEKHDFLYDAVSMTKRKNPYRLCIWYLKSQEDKYRPVVKSLIESFNFIQKTAQEKREK